MATWFIVIVPLVIMFFALGMERVEARLTNMAVRENEVEEFLEQAQPDEVRALYGHGIGRALELFRLRRLGGRTPRRGRNFDRNVRGTDGSGLGRGGVKELRDVHPLAEKQQAS